MKITISAKGYESITFNNVDSDNCVHVGKMLKDNDVTTALFGLASRANDESKVVHIFGDKSKLAPGNKWIVYYIEEGPTNGTGGKFIVYIDPDLPYFYMSENDTVDKKEVLQ